MILPPENNQQTEKKEPTLAIRLGEGALGSLICTVLLGLGVFLSSLIPEEKKQLEALFNQNKVEEISSWYIELINRTESSFDFCIEPPKSELIYHKYSFGSNHSSIAKGKVLKDQKLEILFIHRNPTGDLSINVINELIKVEYDGKDKKTGETKKINSKIKKKGSSPILRELLKIIVTILPITIGIIILFILIDKQSGTSTT